MYFFFFFLQNNSCLSAFVRPVPILPLRHARFLLRKPPHFYHGTTIVFLIPGLRRMKKGKERRNTQITLRGVCFLFHYHHAFVRTRSICKDKTRERPGDINTTGVSWEMEGTHSRKRFGT
jgi:hypothetical protein